MKRKWLPLLVLSALFLSFASLPVSALPKISTAMDCLAAESVLVKSAVHGNDIVFSEADFTTALGVRDIGTLTVATLPDPATGVLRLANLRVSEGQAVKPENLAYLRFTPASDLVEEASFTFTAENLAGGAALTCTLRFADSVGGVPTVGDAALSVMTQQSVAVFGEMTATDPDGDRITYEVLSYPERGTLRVIDKESGEFRYTPDTGYTGKDSFTYRARDVYGNYSPTASVEISVCRRTSDAVFRDMEDHPAYNAALHAVAEGIMTGSAVDGKLYFSPDTSMTRAAFVRSAMTAAGITPDAYTATTFDDNDAIAAEDVAYIATAQARGIVHGKLTEEGLCFLPDAPITRAEAAMVLSAVFGLTPPDAPVMSFEAGDGVAIFARPAVSACVSAGILDISSGTDAVAAVSRAEAAEMFYRAMGE